MSPSRSRGTRGLNHGGRGRRENRGPTGDSQDSQRGRPSESHGRRTGPVHAPRERCRHRDTVMEQEHGPQGGRLSPARRLQSIRWRSWGGRGGQATTVRPPPAVHPGPGSFLLRRTSSLHLPVGRALRHAVSPRPAPRPSVPASLMASPAARPSPARPSHSCLFISKNFTST